MAASVGRFRVHWMPTRAVESTIDIGIPPDISANLTVVVPIESGADIGG
jgi:hypothetical protein